MFESTSRYASLETATYTANGRTIAYKRRRFVPPVDSSALLTEVAVTQGDRLDVIAAKTLGDPEQFWRIADANHPLNPVQLTDQPGRVLRVPIPRG